MKYKKIYFILVAIPIAVFSLQTASSITQWLPAPPTAGRYLYQIISGIGTMVTYGQILNQINRPSQEGSRLRARPKLHTFESMKQSGVYRGEVLGETKITGDHRYYDVIAGDRGNYQIYNFSSFSVAWDEDDQEHYKVPYSETYGEGPSWISTSQWRAAVDSPGAAQQNNWLMPWEDPWARPGFWIVSAYSTKYEYPDVVVESEVWNPAWFGTTLDGELVDRAAELKLTYHVKLHYKLEPLTWVEGPYGGHWTGGTRYSRNQSCLFPGYKKAQVTKTLCPPNTRINGEALRGGMDIWWNKNVNYVYAMLHTQALDSNGNPTGNISVHEGQIQKNESWVVDYSVQSTSL
jgi:hypothetical protein